MRSMELHRRGRRPEPRGNGRPGRGGLRPAAGGGLGHDVAEVHLGAEQILGAVIHVLYIDKNPNALVGVF